MKLFTLAVATTTLVTPFLATSALAADAVVYNEPAAPVIADKFSWTGGYIGANAGYAKAKAPLRNTNYNDDYTDATDYDPDGFFGGLYTGYNKQFDNNVVVGIDADLNIANIKSEGGDYYSEYLNGVWPFIPSSKMKWNGAVRARLGYAYDRVLPYIAGGVSFGEYEIGLRFLNDRPIFSEKTTMTGWNIGGGVEYAATDHLILRAEYRYTDFGSKTFHNLAEVDVNKIKLSTHDFRVGLAYKF